VPLTRVAVCSLRGPCDDRNLFAVVPTHPGELGGGESASNMSIKKKVTCVNVPQGTQRMTCGHVLQGWLLPWGASNTSVHVPQGWLGRLYCNKSIMILMLQLNDTNALPQGWLGPLYCNKSGATHFIIG